jgi:sorbitol-specific phosphotransferase system component IIBC
MSIDPKAILDNTLSVSKDALTKAGNAAKDLSEKSVIRVELMQLERKLSKSYETLGKAVAVHFEAQNDTLSSQDTNIVAFLLEITRLRHDIETRQAQLA